MFFLLSGTEKKKKAPIRRMENLDKVRELFLTGKFPVTTTASLDEERRVGKVLGLVVSRGYDSEDAFYDMAARAVNKGAQAIIGYQENVAFHPDGSKFFTCYGTAVQFENAKSSVATSVAALSVRA